MKHQHMCAVTINGTEYPFATILARGGRLQKRGDTWHLRFPHEAERAVTLDLTLAEHIRRARELHQIKRLERRSPVYERKARAWAQLRHSLNDPAPGEVTLRDGVLTVGVRAPDAVRAYKVTHAAQACAYMTALPHWSTAEDCSLTWPMFPREPYSPARYAKG